MDQYDALFMSDIHMSNKLPMALPTDANETDRLLDQIKLWKQVKASAVLRKIKKVHVLGDVVDQSRVDPITLAAMCGSIRDLSDAAEVYIQGGNHDAVSVQGGPFTVEMFGSLRIPNIHYAAAPEHIPTPPWLRFWPVPYASIEQTREILAEYRARMKLERRACEVLLLHHSIIGCSHEDWECDVGLSQKEARKGFDYTLSGHFHTPQYFGEDKRGMYLGSPLHFRFDDAERAAGWWHITFHPQKAWKVEFIRSLLPRFHQLTWPEKIPRDKLKLHADRKDYVRINVSATHAEYAKLKPSVFEYRDQLISKGIRASEHHVPIYHHTKRLKDASKKGGKTGALSLVREYVDAVDVDTNGLERKRLRLMGRQALEAGRMRA